MELETRRALIVRLLTVLFILSITLLGWNIYHSIQLSLKTGTLDVSIDNKAAPLTISAVGTEAKLIGHGSAKIRIVPGTYLIASNYNGTSANTIATVTLRGTTKTTLTPF